MTCTLLLTLLLNATALAQDGGSPWGGDEKKDKEPSGPWGTTPPPTPQPTPAPAPAEGWDTGPAPETPAWEAPAPMTPSSGGEPAWGEGEAPPAPAPTPPPPPSAAPPPPPPRIGPTRDCLSDICARGDRTGGVRLDGVLFVADPFIGVSQFTGSADLAWVSPPPVAGVAAVWMVPVGDLSVPIAPTLLIGARQTWRDYGGNTIHSHGGAVALNVGGLVSGGVGFGHHNTLPINFYDLDGDGSAEQGELRLGSQRVSPYLYVGLTPVTFVRLVGRQWLQSRGG
jgi:hypothetical protein